MSLPKPGTVLYEANEAGGFDAWALSTGWDLMDGTLLYDGTGGERGLLIAPYQPGNMANYAVEAELQMVVEGCPGGFSLYARATEKGRYDALQTCIGEVEIWVMVNAQGSSGQEQADQAFDPGTERHTYRLEVEGTSVRLLIDGTLMIEIQDTRLRSGGTMGIKGFYEAQFVVRSFKVIAL